MLLEPRAVLLDMSLSSAMETLKVLWDKGRGTEILNMLEVVVNGAVGKLVSLLDELSHSLVAFHFVEGLSLSLLIKSPRVWRFAMVLWKCWKASEEGIPHPPLSILTMYL